MLHDTTDGWLSLPTTGIFAKLFDKADAPHGTCLDGIFAEYECTVPWLDDRSIKVYYSKANALEGHCRHDYASRIFISAGRIVQGPPSTYRVAVDLYTKYED